MNPLRRWRFLGTALCWSLTISVTALAQASQILEERLAKAEAAASNAQAAGDNAWMLVCAALVLMMTGPGLALFYGGLVRKKNVFATMMQRMQSVVLMGDSGAQGGPAVARQSPQCCQRVVQVRMAELRLRIERRPHSAIRNLQSEIRN